MLQKKKISREIISCIFNTNFEVASHIIYQIASYLMYYMYGVLYTPGQKFKTILKNEEKDIVYNSYIIYER